MNGKAVRNSLKLWQSAIFMYFPKTIKKDILIFIKSILGGKQYDQGFIE